ncbi:MAG: glycine cleavage system protein GcvH [Desulfurococcales archaeon]|nr:glycine cleavage system protein GcvH [Desulfurococcales archaeon]
MGRYEVETKDFVAVIVEELLYTETDEWVRVEDGRARVGITDYAQKMLKDIVGVELPEKGSSVSRGEAVAILESVKTVAEVYSPVTGTVVDVNERLLEEPELLNKDPYGEGWIFVVELKDPGEVKELMSHERYAEKIRK